MVNCHHAFGNTEPKTFKPTWTSLRRHMTPQWLIAAKFGMYLNGMPESYQRDYIAHLFNTAIALNKEVEFVYKEYGLRLGEVPLSAKFESDTSSIWGGSLVKGDDGLYHMYYSRWKKELGWAWVTHSEIAHAVASSPFGPFEFKDVTLSVRGAEYWDGLCTHNPTVHRFGDKYYLYYMGNTGDGKVTGKPGKHLLNWIHRNNQRIGVAVADHPNGPWRRFDTPLIDVSSDPGALDALMTSNPSITQRPGGGYLMVYKAVGKKKKGIFGGPVVHCVATSDGPAGPFKKYDKPVFQAKGHDFPAEDPFIWYQAGKYRAIVKDMRGAFTDAGQSLVLFDSKVTRRPSRRPQFPIPSPSGSVTSDSGLLITASQAMRRKSRSTSRLGGSSLPRVLSTTGLKGMSPSIRAGDRR